MNIDSLLFTITNHVFYIVFCDKILVKMNIQTSWFYNFKNDQLFKTT
jgi:hypothetical protein